MNRLIVLVACLMMAACASSTAPSRPSLNNKGCAVQVQSGKRCYLVDQYDVEDMQRAFDRK